MIEVSEKVNGVNAQVLNEAVHRMMHKPEMAKVTFQVQTSWDSGDGFKLTSTGKDFLVGGQKVERQRSFTVVIDNPEVLGGKSEGPTVCEMGMASIGSCVSQTLIAYATMMGVQLDRIRVESEADVDVRGMTGISDKVRPGAQEFRLRFHIESKTASKEQLKQLYELGKKFSPAVDTVTNGTIIKMSAQVLSESATDDTLASQRPDVPTT
ncbi:MAG: OsmC family protein [Nitrososphaera sp.]